MKEVKKKTSLIVKIIALNGNNYLELFYNFTN